MPPREPRTGPLERALRAWVALALRRPLATVLAFVALTAASAWYTATRFRISTDRDAMVSPELPFRRVQARLEEEFPQLGHTLVVVIDASTPEGARATARALARACAARDDLFRTVFLPLVDPFLEAHGLLFLSPAELDRLATRLAQVQPFLGRLARDPTLRGLCALLVQALDEEDAALELDALFAQLDLVLAEVGAGRPATLSWQELVGGAQASELRRQLVVLQPRLDYGALFPGERAIAFVREQAAALASADAPAARVRLTGGVALDQEELASVLTGSERIAAVVLALVLAVLAWGLRSWRLVLAVQVALLGGLVQTAAFAMAAVAHLNLISIAFAALYLGLGVDHAIHLALRFQELLAQTRDHARAARAAALDVGPSLVLCALTTAIGFYAFVPTAYSGVSELGLISGTGMLLGVASTLAVLPALFVLGPLRVAPRDARALSPRARRVLALPERRRIAIRVGAGALGALSLALLARVRFDANPLNLRDEASESVATFRDLLEQSGTPPWSLNALAADRAEAERTAAALRALPAVGRALTLASFVPGGQPAKLEALDELSLLVGFDLAARPADGDASSAAERADALDALAGALDARVARAPGDEAARGLGAALGRFQDALARAPAEEAARRTDALERALLATLPESLERLGRSLAARGFGADDLPPELVARWRSPQGSWRVEAFPADDLDEPRAMRRFVDAVRSVAPRATGAPSTILDSGDAVVGAFRQALAAALVAIVVLLAVLLRSARETLLVLAPLLLAAALTGATLVALDLPFNFANVIGLPLLLGTGVDGSLHVVLRARSVRRGLLETSTARGIVYSALTTLCSFASLSASAHPGTASMGTILSIGIAWSLVCSLVVLPAMLAGPAQAGAR